MEGKLIKTDKGNYVLVDPTKSVYDEGYMLGSSRECDVAKLSLKNCQAIERGYDLDELFNEVDESIDYHEFDFTSFRLGFEKSLENLGDKKFTEEELKWLNEAVKEKCYNDQSMNTSVVNKLKSLQQTEWDVVIVTEDTNNQCDGCKSNHDVNDLGMHIYPNSTRAYMVCQKEKYKAPKLDQNGCLILKRK